MRHLIPIAICALASMVLASAQRISPASNINGSGFAYVPTDAWGDRIEAHFAFSVTMFRSGMERPPVGAFSFQFLPESSFHPLHIQITHLDSASVFRDLSQREGIVSLRGGGFAIGLPSIGATDSRRIEGMVEFRAHFVWMEDGRYQIDYVEVKFYDPTSRIAEPIFAYSAFAKDSHLIFTN